MLIKKRFFSDIPLAQAVAAAAAIPGIQINPHQKPPIVGIYSVN